MTTNDGCFDDLEATSTQMEAEPVVADVQRLGWDENWCVMVIGGI